MGNCLRPGFRFHKTTAKALWGAVDRALGCYREPDTWLQLVRTGMKQDFSWKRSAQLYIELYETVIAQRSGEPVAESA